MTDCLIKLAVLCNEATPLPLMIETFGAGNGVNAFFSLV